ncbi:MAG: hypothetical protein LBD55_03835 [Treponema sp.]|nr:hypothetical protein [Treponema sp.]
MAGIVKFRRINHAAGRNSLGDLVKPAFLQLLRTVSAGQPALELPGGVLRIILVGE